MIFLLDLAIFAILWTVLTPVFVWMAPRPLTLLSHALQLAGLVNMAQFFARLSVEVGTAWSRAGGAGPDE